MRSLWPSLTFAVKAVLWPTAFLLVVWGGGWLAIHYLLPTIIGLAVFSILFAVWFILRGRPA